MPASHGDWLCDKLFKLKTILTIAAADGHR